MSTPRRVVREYYRGIIASEALFPEIYPLFSDDDSRLLQAWEVGVVNDWPDEDVWVGEMRVYVSTATARRIVASLEPDAAVAVAEQARFALSLLQDALAENLVMEAETPGLVEKMQLHLTQLAESAEERAGQ